LAKLTIIILLIIIIGIGYVILNPQDDIGFSTMSKCSDDSIVDAFGICRKVNINQDAFDSCADEAQNKTPGYKIVSVPPQDEFGNFLDPNEFSSVIIQCNLPNGNVVHAGIKQ